MKTKCGICEIGFEPAPKQKKAWWAKNWCESNSGLLCPDCHKVAQELGCVSKTEMPLGVLPFASDIMNLSKSPNIDRDKVNEKYKKETWRHWVEENDEY